METVADIADYVAFGVLVFGLFVATYVAVRTFVQAAGAWSDRLTGPVLDRFRMTLGRWLLAGLEVLIVSDILHSIVHRTLNEIGMLALIVLIRTGLSYMLDVEIERLERREEARAVKDGNGSTGA
ncbi:DUF1622 domain-containing protein [Pseudoruegeria sp. HB172150]|uniref:DUF1622 domain-containing protein n=1 Tax=Pseudoruegeria sp. HB172150 TaxID=2721164 RepID=UPI0015538ACC|nr:DUF1622 domain-containing protein [Pseudoruegeria sp. HB172150]